jgi:hypothetical protein
VSHVFFKYVDCWKRKHASTTSHASTADKGKESEFDDRGNIVLNTYNHKLPWSTQLRDLMPCWPIQSYPAIDRASPRQCDTHTRRWAALARPLELRLVYVLRCTLYLNVVFF